MSKVSKLLGALIGAIVGLVGIKLGMPALSPESPMVISIIEVVTPLLTTALGTYLSPKNAD
jgi:uncharacterized protein YacL